MKNPLLYCLLGVSIFWGAVTSFGWWQSHQKAVEIGRKALEVHSATGEAQAAVDNLKVEYGNMKAAQKKEAAPLVNPIKRVITTVTEVNRNAEELAVKVREELIPQK